MPYVGPVSPGADPSVVLGEAQQFTFTYDASSFAAGVTRVSEPIPCQGKRRLRITVKCTSFTPTATGRWEVELFTLQQIRLFVSANFLDPDANTASVSTEIFSAYPQVIPYEVGVTGGANAIGLIDVGFGLRKAQWFYTEEIDIAANAIQIGLNTSQISDVQSASFPQIPDGAVFVISYHLY